MLSMRTNILDYKFTISGFLDAHTRTTYVVTTSNANVFGGGILERRHQRQIQLTLPLQNEFQSECIFQSLHQADLDGGILAAGR